MRVIATLEAAWTHGNDALAVPVGSGHVERLPRVLVAEHGAGRVQGMVPAVTGVAGLEGADHGVRFGHMV